jgi:RNA polymerase sigma-70 factor (sigma-E family)
VALSAHVTNEPFAELFRQQYEPMVRLGYLLTGDREAAEELVQDAFVAVYRSFGRMTNPPAYLRTAVVNNCNSWWRRRRLERTHQQSTPPESVYLVVDELWDALLRLPVRQRAAIVLRFYEDLPENDIAKLLGCRPPTVRTAIHRGLRTLRRQVMR